MLTNIYILMSFIAIKHVISEVVTLLLEDFPKQHEGEVALHMPCQESNMFATKCMCHLRCIDKTCKNAVDLCKKYEQSKGCKYVLLRGGRAYATLKRVPTKKEAERFDISKYPSSHQELEKKDWKEKLKKLLITKNHVNSDEKTNHKSNLLKSFNQFYTNVTFNEYLKNIKVNKTAILDLLFQTPIKGKYCPIKYSNISRAKTNRLNGMRVIENKISMAEFRISSQVEFLERGIALVALSYHTPRTLLNSMQTWRESGFLSLMNEKVVILNDPLPQEIAIALDFDFFILQPKNIPNVKSSKPNVVTIGAAFFYALTYTSSEYLLFLENDFKMDLSLSLPVIQSELLVAAGLLDSGIEIIRLQTRKMQGCGTFKGCKHAGIHLKSTRVADRRRNWFAFYCRGHPLSDGFVSDCFKTPDFRCFTSYDTSWTLNTVLVKRSTMLHKKYSLSNKKGVKSIAQIGLDQYQKQDGFEAVMVGGVPWQNWKVPICISYNGLFAHEEIETAA